MSKKKEYLYYYGLHAVLALFEKRKNSIERVYLKKEHVQVLSPILKWCSEKKLPYNIVEDKDLEKLTDSTHHEGVCIVAKPKDELDEDLFFTINGPKEKSLVLFLNHIENPHNLGAIARTCAHFNIRYILTDCPISLSPSCCRIAQGGAEVISLVKINNAKATLKKLREEGYDIVSTSSHTGSPLHKEIFSKKTVLVMGSETHGVDKKILELVNKTVSIEGTGAVESLNVSQATALCCFAYFCQHGL